MNRTNYENLHLAALRGRYGELMTLKDVMDVFKYKTEDSVRKAFKRGTLPVKLYRFEGKSGLFAKTIEVAECIDNLSVS